MFEVNLTDQRVCVCAYKHVFSMLLRLLICGNCKLSLSVLSSQQ